MDVAQRSFAFTYPDTHARAKRLPEREHKEFLPREGHTQRPQCVSLIPFIYYIFSSSLFSYLVRSNLSSDSSQQMSEEEVLCQISTFLAAGHETTSSALTWCLYALAKDQRVQRELRTALRAIEEPGFQDGDNDNDRDRDKDHLVERIARCTYLDWVVRESLRVHAPVTNTMRVCMRDEDEIPVRSPVNGSSCRDGIPYSSGGERGDEVEENETELKHQEKTDHARSGSRRGQRTTISVRKWDIISVPIQAINKSEVFWGEDARVFRYVVVFCILSPFFLSFLVSCYPIFLLIFFKQHPRDEIIVVEGQVGLINTSNGIRRWDDPSSRSRQPEQGQVLMPPRQCTCLPVTVCAMSLS